MTWERAQSRSDQIFAGIRIACRVVCMYSYWCCHLLHPGSLLFPAYNLLWTAWTLSALAKTLVGLDTCVEFVGSMHVDKWPHNKTYRHSAPWPYASCQIHLPIDHTTDQLQLPIFDALLWNRSVSLFLHAGLFGKHFFSKDCDVVFAFNLSFSVHFICPGKFKVFS